MRSILITCFLVAHIFCEETLQIVSYSCKRRSTQNSMYIDLRVGGEPITIAVGSNVPFVVITGSECAEKEVCGKAPGYDVNISPTVKLRVENNVKNFTIPNVYVPGVNDRIFEGEILED